MNRIPKYILLLCAPYLYLAIRSSTIAGFFNVLNENSAGLLFDYIITYAALAGAFVYILFDMRKHGEMPAGILAISFIIIVVCSLFITPSSSCDFYYYISNSVIQGKFGLNPYFTAINQLPKEGAISFGMVGGYPSWTPMTYGYVIVLALKMVYRLAGGQEVMIYIILKLINAAAIWVIYIHIKKLAEFWEAPAAKYLGLLFLLNPIIIIQYLINGHNDCIMAMFLTLGLYYLTRNWFMLAYLAFLLALHTKLMAVFALPFLIIYFYKSGVSLKQFILGALIFAAALLPYWHFYNLKDIPPGIINYRESYDASFFVALYYAVSRFVPLPNQLISKAQDAMSVLWLAVYAVLFLWGLWTIKDKKEWTMCRLIEAAFLVFIAFFANVLYPWYILWMIPFIFWRYNMGRRLLIYSAVFMWGELYYAFIYKIAYTHPSFYLPSVFIFYIISLVIYIFGSVLKSSHAGLKENSK